MKGTVEQVLTPSQIPAACREVCASGGRMQMAYAWFPEPGKPAEVVYMIDQHANQPFQLFRCRLSSTEEPLPSLAVDFPLMGWYEREMMDLCGLRFIGHPEPYPLVLHEGATASLPPLDPRYPTEQRIGYEAAEWKLPPVEGSDVQILPFGPVRADVLESAQIVFYYVGEAILHCHPRLFFKHRGMEKRFEALSPALAPLLGTVLAERVSGVDSVSHALAFCHAVERAAECEVPARAQYVRVILAELERLYNHLHYFGYLCHTTTLKVGEAEGKLLSERAKQINGRLTGSRFLRGILKPGGLRRDLDLSKLAGELEGLKTEIFDYIDGLEVTNSHLDRLITTGKLPNKTAYDQGASGPIKRASGICKDLRADHVYSGYRHLAFETPMRTEGDAHARAQVRMAEIRASIQLIEQALETMPAGEIAVPMTAPVSTEAVGWAEGVRGSTYYCVHFGESGQLQRVKIKSPSFSNWRVFPFTVHDTNMMDYAINEASFGLTMAGCDR